jgi:ribosome maturation protein Sdo1
MQIVAHFELHGERFEVLSDRPEPGERQSHGRIAT